MGSVLSLTHRKDYHALAKEEVTNALVKSKLIDLRAHKKNRDELIGEDGAPRSLHPPTVAPRDKRALPSALA